MVFNRIEREIREEGRLELFSELIKSNLVKGKSHEQIQDYLNVTNDEYRELIKKIQGTDFDKYTEILFGDEIREHGKQVILRMIEQGWTNKQIIEITYEDEEKIEELRLIYKNQKE
ncbi:hypothetical protein ACS2B2_25775 [Bacillus cereus group sp. BceL297]|uniref:hypothetical protein n=1 Tax=unclassified Bacillus cereus group TaxID=2750818 RepID=UPI003F29CCA6